MKKPLFVENEIYHIYNRGVEKRNVFMSDEDYLRFIHDLFEFNNEDPVLNANYHFNPRSMLVQRGLTSEKRPRKLLVEILAFILMPNHFHLLVRQKKHNGVVKFMQKIGSGYTNFFNKKYERVGSLFQGRFKAVLVKGEAHFIHLPFYIHTNCLNLNYGSSTSINLIDLLNKYRWSSYFDYTGKINFPSVTSRDFLLNFFGDEKKYQKATEKWVEGRETNILD